MPQRGGDHFQSFPLSGNFGADPEIGFVIDQRREPVPQDEMIVDDEDSPHRRDFSCRAIARHGLGPRLLWVCGRDMQPSVALFLTFQPVFLWDTTLQWTRRERIGAVPCLWHGGIPHCGE
jgi:hypothetical protein